MRNLNHFTKGWHICKRLSFVALLGLGIVFQSPLVQAQDSGGQQGLVAYELIISDNPLDRFCVGQTEPIPLKVRASAVVVGGETAGRVRMLGDVTTTLTSQDPDVASVALSIGRQGAAPDVPFEIEALITGTNIGRTSILVEVSAQSINRFGAASSFQLRKTIPVHVVPCEYLVELQSIWVTTMYDATTLITAQTRLITLKSTSGINFANNPGTRESPMLRWQLTANRFKGCYAGSARTDTNVPQITGQIIDDELILNVEYEDLLPDLTGAFYLSLCPNLPITIDCRNNIDGVCPAFPIPEQFTPAVLDIKVPVAGGTAREENHTLNHRTGNATGFTVITVERRTPQSQ